MKHRITNIANQDVLEIDVYGVIGDEWDGGITPKMLRNAIKNSGNYESVNIYINSPGGSAFDGIAIYNQLKAIKKPVSVYIDGEAASAASVIAMAGDELIMRSGSMLMIHNASAISFGNKEDMKKSAGILDRVDSQLASIYAIKTGMNVDEIKKLMDAETWMDGQEAIDFGFADRIEGEAELLIASSDAQAIRDKFQNKPIGIEAMVCTPPVIQPDANDIPIGRDADQGESKESSMTDIKDLTLEEFTASRPDLVESIKATVEIPDVEAVKAEATNAGGAIEFERITAISAEAKRLRIVDVGNELIANKTATEEAIKALQAKAIEAYVAMGPENPGPDAEIKEETKPQSKGDRLYNRALEIQNEQKLPYAEALVMASKEVK